MAAAAWARDHPPALAVGLAVAVLAVALYRHARAAITACLES